MMCEQEKTTALLIVEDAMKQAERVTETAAEEHFRAFAAQMREKIGMDEIALEEPYLPVELARLSLDYLRRLEALEMRAADGGWSLPQVEARLAADANRHKRRVKQALDKDRQQAFGIRKYVWRTSGDDRVRPSHGALDGMIFTWGESELNPGDDPGCRCSAEPVADGAGEPRVEVAGLDKLAGYALLAAKIVSDAARRRLAREAARRAAQEAAKPKPEPTKPADTPPVKPSSKPDISKRPEGVPKDWKQVPSNKGEGVKYQDSKNSQNEVRIQKGDPKLSNPGQRQDYVKWKHNGQWLDKNGNPVPGNSPEAHIPLDKFQFDPKVFQ